MGRLIDADKLLETLQDLEPHCENKDYEREMLNTMRDYMPKIINDEPTAYDVDKVVKQLGKLKKTEKDRPDSCDENGYGDAEQIYDDGRSQGRFEAYRKAIEIVKSGGVDID